MTDIYTTDSDDVRFEPYQLLPVKGGRYNKVFKGPEGTDIGDLYTDIEPIGGEEPGQILVIVHSGWAPTEEQIQQLDGGAHIRLAVWQYPIPPLAVSIEPPVCACHGEPMDWDGEDCGYYCCRLTVQEKNKPLAEADVDATKKLADAALEQARRDFTPDEGRSSD